MLSQVHEAEVSDSEDIELAFLSEFEFSLGRQHASFSHEEYLIVFQVLFTRIHLLFYFWLIFQPRLLELKEPFVEVVLDFVHLAIQSLI